MIIDEALNLIESFFFFFKVRLNYRLVLSHKRAHKNILYKDINVHARAYKNMFMITGGKHIERIIPL